MIQTILCIIYLQVHQYCLCDFVQHAQQKPCVDYRPLDPRTFGWTSRVLCAAYNLQESTAVVKSIDTSPSPTDLPLRSSCITATKVNPMSKQTANVV